MSRRSECEGCPFHIPASDGCTRIAHGLKCHLDTLYAEHAAERKSALDTQVGGAHYKGLGAYQPWLVLKATLTPEEFRGYMKGTALVYLLRDGKKGDDDLGKATHTLEGFLEMAKGSSSA